MSDMLIIATSAATTFRKALDVTSHNVANVGTEGYSRQRAEIYSNAPSIVGGAFLGGGSRVDLVERMYADYIQKQLVSTNASVMGFKEALSYSKQVEGIVAGNDEGVQQFIQRYFDSMQNLADNPTSRVNRQLMLDEANNLTGHINNISAVLTDTQYQVNAQLKDTVNQINSQLEIIQRINTQVSIANSQGRQPPNDLYDQREQAILELSNLIEVKTFRQPDGTIDIHSINGKVPLLSDNTLTRLEAAPSPYPDENRIEIYVNNGGQRKQVSDLLIGGGQLGGVLDFRKNMLDRSQNELGVMINAFVASNNWQHYMGYDENGNPGKDLFSPLQTHALHSSDNLGVEDGTNIKITFNPNPTGVAVPYSLPETQIYGEKVEALSEAYKQIAEMQPRSYQLLYNGSEFQVYDHATSRPVTDDNGVVYTIAPGSEATIDGMHFDLTGVTPTDVFAGDRFIIKPHQEVLKSFAVEIRDGQEIATRGQNPIEEYYDPAIDINSDGITSYTEFMTGHALPTPLTVADFNASIGAAGIGERLDKNGDGFLDRTEFDMLKASAAKPGGEGDNVNIANMATLQSKKIMFANDSGQPAETLLGGYSRMASSVGMYVHGLQVQFDAQTNTYNHILERRETLSGVSLDEEAANLMRFQQAYQAAAQVMQTAQSIFQTLLGAIRG